MNTSHLAPRANSGGALQPRNSVPRNLVESISRFSSGSSGIRLRRLVLIGFWFLSATPTLAATDVTLAWDPNPETDILGYKLSYGTTSGVYPTVVDTGSNTQVTVTSLVEGTTYYFVVSATNTAGVQSPDSTEISYYAAPIVELPSGVWSLHYADSQESQTYQAANAFDGNPGTFWHTAWSGNPTPPPHEIQINLGASQIINGFRYLPRQDTKLVGNVGQFEFYVSADGVNWGNPVATGTFSNTRELKEIRFTQTSARFIRLRGLSDANGGNYMTVAELEVIQDSQPPKPNQAPLAVPKSLSTGEDTAANIALLGTDADNDPLIFSVVSAPTKGSLSGIAPNLTYTPSANYTGTDSFTYLANDGTVDSASATVSITVTAVNDTPHATAKSVTTSEETLLPITLAGTDPDADSLTFSIVAAPANGTLTGTAPNLTYSPSADYHGPDSFTFSVSDGTLVSALATVSITVTPANDAPVALANSVTTPEDKPVAIVLTGTDPEKGPLTYTVVSSPTKGTLSGTAPNITYSPSADYHGPDSFTFSINDGTLDSALATVSIAVTPTNDAPVALANSATTPEDKPVAIVLTGSDPEKSSLTYTVVSGPTKGTLSGTAPNLTYSPSANYHGGDSFTFRVNDGNLDSALATLSITITSVNDAPVANSFAVQTPVGLPVAVVLTGSDPDGSTPTCSIVSAPAKGSLTGTPPALTYQPNPDATGSDQFTYLASDGSLNSSVATVSISITPVINEVPGFSPVFTASSISMAGAVGSPLGGQLTASHPISEEVLTFSKFSGPDWLTVSPSGALSGTPQDANIGSNSFIVEVRDSNGESDQADLTITVFAPTAVNRAPVFTGNPIFSIDASENAPYSGQSLAGKAVDPDTGDTITYWKISGPEWLNVARDGQLSGTPPSGSAGTNSYGIRAVDSSLATVDTELRINVVGLPLPWRSSDLGWGQFTGSVSYLNGFFTQKGSGALGQNTDKTRFTYQTITGNQTIVAKVRMDSNPGPAGHAGIMIRDSMGPRSSQVFLGLGNDGSYRLASRTRAGAKAVVRSFAKDPSPDTWVRLVRNVQQTKVFAYTSTDGINWTYIGATNVSLARTCHVGLAVSSGSDFTHTVATFSNLHVGP